MSISELYCPTPHILIFVDSHFLNEFKKPLPLNHEIGTTTRLIEDKARSVSWQTQEKETKLTSSYMRSKVERRYPLNMSTIRRPESRFKFTMRSMLLTVVLLLASTGFTAAARDRLTPAPTMSPSNFPSALPSISISPTKSPAPSTGPSATESSVPSEMPSSMPSTSPPSMSPSISASPTESPTGGPSVSPTLKPTTGPTVSPTLNPTNSPTISSVPTIAPTSQPTSVASLPFQTVITFFLRDPAPARRRRLQVLDLAQLELLLTAFFTNALQRHGNFKNSFKSVELDTDPMNDAETGQVTVNVTGNAMYQGAEIPTEEELEEILLTYFSFFGTEDLDTFLKDSYPDMVVSGLALVIGTTKLESSNIDTGNTNTKGDDDPNIGLIVGVVVGALAAVALAGVSLLYRNKMVKEPLERGLVLDDDNTTVNPPNTPPRVGVSPRRMFHSSQPREISPPPPMTPQSDMMGSEQDARSLSGMISCEESLFTTDESYAQRTSFQYDASRLDQVISSAKGFAQGLDGDTDDEVL